MRTTRRWCALALTTALAAIGLVGTSPDAGAAPSLVQACSTTPTSGTVTRTVSGREYRLRVPAGLTGPAPLVLVLHGWNATAAQTETASGMNAFADDADVIVAYPTGSSTGDPILGLIPAPGWKYWEASGADQAYLRDVVTAVSGEFCVNPSRVHAVGFSMGGLMAQRLACNAKDVFASVAGHSTNDVAAAWAGAPQPAACPSSPASLALSCSAYNRDPMSGPCSAARTPWASGARLACAAPAPSADTWGQQESYACGARSLYWRNWASSLRLGHQWPAGAIRTQFFAELAFFFAVTPRP